MTVLEKLEADWRRRIGGYMLLIVLTLVLIGITSYEPLAWIFLMLMGLLAAEYMLWRYPL